MVANGDHVYWDLHSPRIPPERRDNTRLESFTRSALVFGSKNESVLKLAAGPQIVPVYGTDFRSTPVFFLHDDHDYFDNDEAWNEIVTFPPVWFQLQLARATQRLYYPEFLPDETRPRGLPWGSVGDGADGVSESWGTFAVWPPVEVLLYDVRRTCTLAGPSAVYIDPEVERWLLARTASPDVTHLVHAPSNPLGWTAGKWMEWYPDVLNREGRLTTTVPKPYWQAGWLKQHDRLVAAMAATKGRIPITISADLHAVAIGNILRSGSLNLEKSSITAVLAVRLTASRLFLFGAGDRVILGLAVEDLFDARVVAFMELVEGNGLAARGSVKLDGEGEHPEGDMAFPTMAKSRRCSEEENAESLPCGWRTRISPTVSLQRLTLGVYGESAVNQQVISLSIVWRVKYF
jgi:hypothetical protein